MDIDNLLKDARGRGDKNWPGRNSDRLGVVFGDMCRIIRIIKKV
jgi:hypothetical protein